MKGRRNSIFIVLYGVAQK